MKVIKNVNKWNGLLGDKLFLSIKNPLQHSEKPRVDNDGYDRKRNKIIKRSKLWYYNDSVIIAFQFTPWPLHPIYTNILEKILVHDEE